MIRVGLTGGIAAGKSVACRFFQARGIPVLDYDQLARVVVEPGTRGLAAVVDAFSDAVLADDGTLNRSKLAHVVFHDPEALDRLEAIIHPLVIEEGQRLDAEAMSRGEWMIVHSIPLLVEAIGPDAFDVVLVIDAPPDVRVARLVAERAMTEEEAWARIRAQSDDSVRLEVADVILDGSGTVEELREQVEEWMDEAARAVPYRASSERTKFLVTEDWDG